MHVTRGRQRVRGDRSQRLVRRLPGRAARRTRELSCRAALVTAVGDQCDVALTRCKGERRDARVNLERRTARAAVVGKARLHAEVFREIETGHGLVHDDDEDSIYIPGCQARLSERPDACMGSEVKS